MFKEKLSRTLMGSWKVNAGHKCVMFLNTTLTFQSCSMDLLGSAMIALVTFFFFSGGRNTSRSENKNMFSFSEPRL